MSAKKPPPPDFDDDAPELTDEEIATLRPAREVFAELGIPMPKPVGRSNDVTPTAPSSSDRRR